MVLYISRRLPTKNFITSNKYSNFEAPTDYDANLVRLGFLLHGFRGPEARFKLNPHPS